MCGYSPSMNRLLSANDRSKIHGTCMERLMTDMMCSLDMNLLTVICFCFLNPLGIRNFAKCFLEIIK